MVSISICLYYALMLFLHRDVCIIKNVTGIPCPGCGLTRAGVALLHGDLYQAMLYHGLIVPVIIFILYAALKKGRIQTQIVFVFAVLFIGYYLVRMALYFPNTSPMDFNSNGIIPSFLNSLH